MSSFPHFVLVDMDGDTSDLFQTSVDGSWRGPQIPRTHLMKPNPIEEANFVLAIKKQQLFFAIGCGHQTGMDMIHGTPMGIFFSGNWKNPETKAKVRNFD